MVLLLNTHTHTRSNCCQVWCLLFCSYVLPRLLCYLHDFYMYMYNKHIYIQ